MQPTDTCPCGRSHICPIRSIEIGENALSRLPAVCEAFDRILLVADRNTYQACGERAVHLLGARVVDTHIYDTDAVLIPNEDAIDALRMSLGSGPDLIVGIGSGVINDLCKYVGYAHHLPYVIVATAPSMDGYASAGAALILGGMKVTLSAQPPMAIVADTAVLCHAPMDMIRAGYGDIIGKYSCLNDWKLAALIRGEYICDAVWQWVKDTADRVRALAPAINRREKAAMEALMRGLVDVGIAMAYVGNSRPASGSEHHLSHFFEITGILRERPYLPHGMDVAYASVVTAHVREWILARTPVPRPFNRETYMATIRSVYGGSHGTPGIADAVIELQDKMGWYGDRTTEAFILSHMEEIRTILREAPSAAETRAMVEAVGLSFDDFIAFYGRDTVETAVRWGKDLKDRYSVLWLCDLFAPIDFPARVMSGYWPEGHVQGIAVDSAAGAVYYSFTTILLKTDLAGHPIGSVKNIAGHLGCIDFDPVRRRVYGSLELKHDAIGAGIVARTGRRPAEEDAFYLVSFDADRIDRMDMDAERDNVMQAVWLPDVAEDYAAMDEVSGSLHRYGCSGIDGTAIGPAPGEDADGPRKILIAYGIYGNTEREDNDHQIILQFDPSVVDAYGQPLSQTAPHHSGVPCERRYFFHTGNTTYGIQNLEYDPYTRTYLAAVYPGSKTAYVNHPLFFIDAAKAPVERDLPGRFGERGLCLAPADFHMALDARGGCAFPWGQTGVAALGDGIYAFSRHLDRPMPDGGCAYASEVVRYRLEMTGGMVFAED